MNKSLFALLIGLAVALAGCSAPQLAPQSGSPDAAAQQQIERPEQCRGDGAAQTWLVLPLDPPELQLTTAYRAGQVVEFTAQVIGLDDDPARAPHRRIILSEMAEGITVTLDYQGDPPLLAPQQSYRLVAWADIVGRPPAEAQSSPVATPALPEVRSYGFQVFDDAGLLFLGLTNTDLRDDPLGVELIDGEGVCPSVPVRNNPCVVSRQVRPLEVRWGDDAVTLYPGEDGQLAHGDALYQVSLFRNRGLELPELACSGYRELTRSLRLQRIDPPPVIIPPPAADRDADDHAAADRYVAADSYAAVNSAIRRAVAGAKLQPLCYNAHNVIRCAGSDASATVLPE